MAVGNFKMAQLNDIDGVKLATGAAGIKKNNQDDVLLVEISAGANIACVFTKNLFSAAPVQISKQHLSQNPKTRYLLINSGNANAGTGQLGLDVALESAQAVAKHGDCELQQVLLFSTGVIGQLLPSQKIIDCVPLLFSKLKANAWQQAAAAIMTTDTYAKAVSKKISIAGCEVNITGIIKGAGMIKPNMATLLSFVATDAKLSPALLQQLLSRAVDKSLNSITIDGDTSTNDSCVLIATGASSCILDGSDEPALEYFAQQLDELFIELAQILVRDGEGATKFIEIDVQQARSISDGKKVAYKIAESPLVKTALFASDPNWGRILAAIGNADVALDIDNIDLYINDVCIVKSGGLAKSYTEQQGVDALAVEEITIKVVLHNGHARHKVWTTDLSYDYIKINAEYRT